MSDKQHVEKENTYCLVCKKETDNKKISKQKATKASLCTVCTSKTSTFLKGIKKNNWAFEFFTKIFLDQ